MKAFSDLTRNELIKRIENLESRIDELKKTQVKPDNKGSDQHQNFVEYFENSPDMYFSVKTDGTIISVNETGAKALGYSKPELIGKKVWKVVYKDDLNDVKKKIGEIIAKKTRVGELEFRKIKKDGSIIYVQEKTQLIEKDAHVIGLRITCRDNTFQKLALENLKAQEEKFRTLANNLNVGIYRSTADKKGRFIEMNPAFVKMFGYSSREEMMVKSVSDLYKNAEDRTKLQKDLESIGHFNKREIELKKKNGETYVGSLSTVAIRDDSGKTKYYDGIIEDITERKKATEEIIRKEEQYRTLFDLSPNGVLIEDKKGIIIDANPAFCQMMGYTREELLRINVTQLSSDSDESVNQNIKMLLDGKQLKHITKSRRKDGVLIYTELHERIFELEGATAIICIAEDVTERIAAQKELRQSEESYRGLFNSTNDAIYVQDKQGKFLDVNTGAIKMYGYPKNFFIGKTPQILSAPGKNDLKETAKRLKKAFEGKPQVFEFWGIDKNKRVFPKEVKMNKSSYFGQDVVVVFAQDITERKAAQKSLEEKEQKLRRIFNAFPDIYFKSDIKGVVEEISPSVTKIAGYQPEEIIGEKSKRFYYSQEEWNEISRLVFDKGEVNDFDTRIKCKNGQIINCSLTARLVYDENNRPFEIEGVLRDITDRKNTEVALWESNRRLSTLMDNLPGMAYRCANDHKWTMIFVSNGCRELTGYESDDIIGNKKKSYNDIIHPDDRERVWKSVQEALKKKTSYRMTYRIETADLATKWVWEQGSGVYSEEDSLQALEGFITDITDQRRAEEEVRKLSRSVEQSPNIVIIADLNARIEYVNPRFSAVTGYTAEEVIGRNPRFLKSGKTPKESYTAMWNRLTSGLDWSGEFQNRKKNGEVYWESANIFPLKNEEGEISHYISMKEDITDRKKMEKDLIRAKEKAEESDRLKSAFLANMSHEIRTPMNAIIGFSQLLNDESISSDEKAHFIDLIQKSGNDLLRLIDDIIDISKIEAGQLKVFKSQYFLDNILEEIYNSYQQFLKTKPDKANVKLQYKQPKDKKTVIFTDIDRFRQIFRNLLNNAIKFTESGLIEFGFRKTSDKTEPMLEFYVRDTGIGVPADKLEVIFQSFRQANDSDTRLYGGTGLGLAITRRMVELLGGKIWVESAKGQGSTFYFTLPFKKIKLGYFQESMDAESSKKDIQNYDWSGKNILIVEDDDNSYIYFKNILSRTNIRIQRAVNGTEALEKVRKGNFNVVLMDIRIPRLNGLKTTTRIKEINKNIPVIAQTAYAMEGEKEKCIKAGCDDYISKPIKINDFFTIINKHII